MEKFPFLAADGATGENCEDTSKFGHQGFSQVWQGARLPVVPLIRENSSDEPRGGVDPDFSLLNAFVQAIPFLDHPHDWPRRNARTMPTLPILHSNASDQADTRRYAYHQSIISLPVQLAPYEPAKNAETDPLIDLIEFEMIRNLAAATYNSDSSALHLPTSPAHVATSKFADALIKGPFKPELPDIDWVNRAEIDEKRVSLIYQIQREDFLKHRDAVFAWALSDANGDGACSPKLVRIYRCKQCEYVAKSKDDYWSHSRLHIKVHKQLSCPKCLFVTEHKHHLEYHLRNHFGSKPFKCSKCSYTCVNNSMLKSHMKSHTTVRDYHCADCNYATKYCHSLKLHLRKRGHKANSSGSPNAI